eukprot:TRINITY_DN9870_c0_g1_i2.p1 TRINITY_DN9870_c0_g1~~TRINITY_DN9870_c0_g1_i2.p1  ORF type:complete len:214 (-),score=20.02 TRINITY_DN9870_c0_g1_i2:33-674(-)
MQLSNDRVILSYEIGRLNAKVDKEVQILGESAKAHAKECSELFSREYSRRTREKSDQKIRLTLVETGISSIQSSLNSLKALIEDIKQTVPKIVADTCTKAVTENMKKLESGIEEQRKANLEVIRQGQAKGRNATELKEVLANRKSFSRPSTIQSFYTLTKNKNSMTTVKLKRKGSRGNLQYKRYSNPSSKYYAFEDRSNTRSRRYIINTSNLV